MPTLGAATPPPTHPPGRAVRPLDVLAAWPANRPLASLISAGNSPFARWSIFASPTEIIRADHTSPDPLGLLADTLRPPPRTRARAETDAPPFTGGWIGWISYDLGRIFEPTAQRPSRARDEPRRPPWPLFELLRCPAAYIHDATTNTWSIAGDPRLLPVLENTAPPGECRLEPFTPCDAASYQESVKRTVEHVRAGDIFQANIAHRLSTTFRGSTRGIAHRILDGAGAWYGAYLESPLHPDRPHIRHAICSASPELFLSFDPRTRRVVTRPIKGTRGASPTATSDLAESAKDIAELNMIVDLMRNDLGRVCEYGSVKVDDPRAIESHGGPAPDVGIFHGVATVSGTLRHGLGMPDLLRAAFPPGSVTGAPKIRAMRIIDEQEPVRRGPYCGCVGFVSDSGHSAWNVAIRTAAITCNRPCTPASADGLLDYHVGAGIVADSDPELEWQETLHKAGILRRAFPESFSPGDTRPRHAASGSTHVIRSATT
ncbi:MAG: anthranilate synthase component I family protein [Phycisphaerae bacterium]|nr:anthranilate synthase component I family protein [Phycisphaerae bacterium]